MKLKRVHPRSLLPRSRNNLWTGFAIVLALLVVLHIAIPNPDPQHGKLGSFFWFYPLLGLVSSIVLVMLSRGLGKLVKRSENYWEERL